MRHLASMGYRLTYEQDPRTEFDYTISAMSMDLRSGVRLLRAAELLTGKPLWRDLSSAYWGGRPDFWAA